MVRHEAEALGAIASPECLDILTQYAPHTDTHTYVRTNTKTFIVTEWFAELRYIAGSKRTRARCARELHRGTGHVRIRAERRLPIRRWAHDSLSEGAVQVQVQYLSYKTR